ncbi:MAG: UDP-N-acetylglucosamine 2-epimerase [Mucinivorans sp.]
MRKICIVTGTRAEWGLLVRLARLIEADEELQLQIIATNMHLSDVYGLTYKEIEADGFKIDYRVPMETDGDTRRDTVKSMARAMDGFADAYQILQPDMIVVLGDRYEILVAVTAALIFKIPVAHIHGGEITMGAYDDAIRHSITKMSHLHLTSTEAYRQRVIQMGEQPSNVFNVGAIGVENIKKIELWDKAQTEKSLDNFELDRNTILITYHPVTLENNTAENQINELLEALDHLPQVKVIFTMPNSDTENLIIARKIKDWCAVNGKRSGWFVSLGIKRYLSVLQYIGAVVGNSSSGIIEVPSFGIPTINIGDRQKGRLAAVSVINCQPTASDITTKIREVIGRKPTSVSNPYEKENTAQEILQIIKTHNSKDIIKKHFFNIQNG